MRNSYDIIFNDVLLKDFGDTYFMHNPNSDLNDEVLMDMFRYFKSKKEWDKVVKITTLRAKIKFYDTTKRLSRAYSKQGD
jgi:hypothetical protein